MQANQSKTVQEVREGNPSAVPEAFKIAIKIGSFSVVELLLLRRVDPNFRSFIDGFLMTNLGFRVIWNYALVVQHNSRNDFRQIKKLRATAFMQAAGKKAFVGDNAEQLFDELLRNVPHARAMAGLVGKCQLLDIDCDDPELVALSEHKKRLFQFFVWGRTETKRVDESQLVERFLASLGEADESPEKSLLHDAEVVLAEPKYEGDDFAETRAVLSLCILAAHYPETVPGKDEKPFYVCFVRKNLSGSFVNQQFSYANFHGFQLNQLQLESNDFTGAVFSSCAFSFSVCRDQDLSGLNFQDSRLAEVKFINSSLRGCDFREASIQCCSFVGTDVSGANFANAQLSLAEILQTAPLTEFVSFDGVRWSVERITKEDIAALLKRPDIFEHSDLVFSLPLDNVEALESASLVKLSLACLRQVLNRCDSVKALTYLCHQVFQEKFGYMPMCSIFSKPLDVLDSMTLFVDACERLAPLCDQPDYAQIMKRTLLSIIEPRCGKTNMDFHARSINDAWNALKVRVENATAASCQHKNSLSKLNQYA